MIDLNWGEFSENEVFLLLNSGCHHLDEYGKVLQLILEELDGDDLAATILLLVVVLRPFHDLLHS
jgi:hypothetical protein